MSAPAAYDLNAVADAIATVFDGVSTGETYDGVAQKVTGHSDVPPQPNVPAVVLELETISWDESMGGGADSFTFIATALVQYADSDGAQRSLRSFLSRDGGAGKLKAALEASRTLGGLVSYAHMQTARRIGLITYNDVQYLGAEMVIEVMS